MRRSTHNEQTQAFSSTLWPQVNVPLSLSARCLRLSNTSLAAALTEHMRMNLCYRFPGTVFKPP